MYRKYNRYISVSYAVNTLFRMYILKLKKNAFENQYTPDLLQEIGDS